MEMPIIFNHENDLVEPFTSTTVQHLFKTKACIPMNPHYEANPCIYPNNPSQLWRLSSRVYHDIDAPDTIPPLDLATRLIQDITTTRGSDSVHRAWALPHLENALKKPTDQINYNPFAQHNHPEFQHKNKTPDILLGINPGESSTEYTLNEMTTKSISCKPLTPFCQRHNDVTEAKVEIAMSSDMYWKNNNLLPITIHF
jgi:hypothetical protein